MLITHITCAMAGLRQGSRRAKAARPPYGALLIPIAFAAPWPEPLRLQQLHSIAALPPRWLQKRLALRLSPQAWRPSASGRRVSRQAKGLPCGLRKPSRVCAPVGRRIRLKPHAAPENADVYHGANGIQGGIHNKRLAVNRASRLLQTFPLDFRKRAP